MNACTYVHVYKYPYIHEHACLHVYVALM